MTLDSTSFAQLFAPPVAVKVIELVSPAPGNGYKKTAIGVAPDLFPIYGEKAVWLRETRID